MSADHGAVDDGPHPVRKTMATTEQRATESFADVKDMAVSVKCLSRVAMTT